MPRVKRTKRHLLIASVLAAALLVSCGGSGDEGSASDEELTKVNFTLEFLPMGDHAVWYSGLENGFFEDEGLDLEIQPGETNGVAVQRVVTGAADIAATDIAALATARAADPEAGVTMFAVLEVQAPYAVFSLSDGADLQTVDDLNGATLHAPLTSSLDDLTAGWAADAGVDDLEIKNVNPQNQYALLIAGKIPAVIGRIGSKVSIAPPVEEAGKELVTLALAEQGMDNAYGTILAIKDSFADANPDVVDAFVRAMRKSYEWAFENPEEASQILVDEFATLDKGQVLSRLEIYEGLVTDDGALAPDEIGSFEIEKLHNTFDYISEGLEGGAVQVEDLYSTTFAR